MESLNSGSRAQIAIRIGVSMRTPRMTGACVLSNHLFSDDMRTHVLADDPLEAEPVATRR
ncbi:hypothetical protein BZM27_28940 [Paraburkholderia steynii]|uniref:Uncharacterized protein n=1 Tax=Paraburkholderia steynii TaxID=1245441 RepID=A0A4R0XIM8_9BURK|nr:hypothetical protein BZM27_28940 [Paraburkholderia steynii]